MSAIIRLPKTKYNKILKGAGITVNASDIHDSAKDAYELSFKNPKLAKKLNRSMENGKNMRIKLEHLESINPTGMSSGGNIGKKIQRGLKKAGIKKLVKGLANTGLTAGMAGISTMLTGDPTMGMVAGEALSDNITSKAGLGLKGKDIKKLGRTLRTVGKAINNNKELREVSRAVKPVLKEMAKAVVEQKVSDASLATANYLDKKTGNSYYGDKVVEASERALNTKGMSMSNGHAEMEGMGLSRTRGRGIRSGGAIDATSEAMANITKFTAPGGRVPANFWNTPKEKMAYVRSFRKGGSGLLPLGSR